MKKENINSRVEKIQNALENPKLQRATVTAVVDTEEGMRVVASSSKRGLRPKQILALHEKEIGVACLGQGMQAGDFQVLFWNGIRKNVLAYFKILDPPKATIILLLICGRLSRNYEKFCKEEKWGDNNFLNEILEQVWDSIIEGKKLENGSLLVEEVDKKIPHEDDFGHSDFASCGIEAMISVNYLLESILLETDKFVDLIITSDFNSIFQFSYFQDENKIEEFEKTMRAEEAQILDEIAFLKNTELTKANLINLKSKLFPPTFSNVGF